MDQILTGKLQDFRARIAINRNDLEHECEMQAFLYEEIAQEVTTANYLCKQAKADFEYAEATLLCEIKEKPLLFGLEKAPSGEHALAKVQIQPKYQELQKVYFEADQVYRAMVGLQEASAQRKSMLRDLVDLFVHQYYTSQELQKPSSRMVGSAKTEDHDSAIADIRKRRAEDRQQENDESVVKED